VKGGEAGSGEHLGIGLTIVKRIVDIHEATIDIESRSQKGTKVTIIFPMTEKSTSFQTTPYRDNIKKI
jgi:signal transduction histidine kinase